MTNATDALRALIAAVRDLDLYNGSTDSVRLKDRLDELCDAAEQALATPAGSASGGITVHEIAKVGLPPMEGMTGRVAFIFDGCLVSGWPLPDDAVSGEVPWEANGDVGRRGVFWGVTHWVEFPVEVWNLAATQGSANGQG